MKILLLEDEKDLSASAVMQLEIKGHKVHPVYDIAEAREALANPDQKYQMVIADHQLPDGKGIHFVEEVRDAHPHCSFAIVSGCLLSEDVERLERLKIPYLRKPLIYSKVLDQLRRMHTINAPVQQVSEASEDAPPEDPLRPFQSNQHPLSLRKSRSGKSVSGSFNYSTGTI